MNGEPSIKVFISSTYMDNAERRRVVEDAVLRAGMQPVGMERFNPSYRPTVEECKRLARECDVYVGIVAHRYGWGPDGREISITEIEYDAAKGEGRDRYMLEIDLQLPVHPDKDFDEGPERWEKQKKLEAFRKKYRTGFVAVETTLGEDTESVRYRGREQGVRLAALIAERSELRALAANPLMLQIIALVHRDRNVLPDRRVELYEACTNVLLEHWDRARGMKVPLTAREAKRVLQPVAYWMHQVPDRRYAPATQIEGLIASGLDEIGKTDLTAASFLESVRDRSGLFTGYGVAEYGFQHLSFQEFLAASEVRRRSAYEGLVAQYGESWWREVTRLLMGLEAAFVPFMECLAQSPRFRPNTALTADCIRDAIEPSVEPFASRSGPDRRMSISR